MAKKNAAEQENSRTGVIVQPLAPRDYVKITIGWAVFTALFVKVPNVPIFPKASILPADGPFTTVGTISVEIAVLADSVFRRLF